MGIVGKSRKKIKTQWGASSSSVAFDPIWCRLAIINFNHQKPANKITEHKFHFIYRRLGLANKRVGVAKSSQKETTKIKRLIVSVFYHKVALK